MDENEDLWFVAFYQKYPRKRARVAAWRAWKKKKISSKQLFDKIMNALEMQIREDFRYREKDKIPYPATWLNGECWRDEIEPHRETEAERRLMRITSIHYCIERGEWLGPYPQEHLCPDGHKWWCDGCYAGKDKNCWLHPAEQ